MAYLEVPLHTSLKKVFDQAPKSKPISESYILRINHLKIYELKHPERISAAEINVSFLTLKNGKYLEVFQAAQYFYLEFFSAPHWHAQNIVDALQLCFDDFEDRKQANLLQPKAIPGNSLTYNPLLKKRPYPLQMANTIPKGIYKTFYDLREQSLDTTIQFYADYFEEKNGFKRATIDIINESDTDGEFYAFSDGESIYIRGGNKYYEMVDSNGNYYLDRHAIDYSDFSSGMITSGILLGPIGVALYAATATPGKSKFGYHLNLDLGTVLPANHKSLSETHAYVFIYNSDFNDTQQVVQFSISDSTVCNIPPGSCYKWQLPAQGSKLSTCVSYNNQEICLEVPPGSFFKDILLIRFNRKGELQFDYASTDKKYALLDEIIDGRINIVCPN
jgi:hypothetical protein